MTDTEQGWDVAEFQCGWCYTTITATSEREYVDLVVGHKETCPGSPAAAR